MAFGLGTAFGVGGGLNDAVNSTLTSHATLRSYHILAYRSGDSSNNFGEIWRATDGTTISDQFYNTSAGVYTYIRRWTTTPGNWTIVRPTTGVWKTCGISYNGGATGNNPIIYIDGASVTVTTVVVPAGSFYTTATNYYLGHPSAVAGTWNGLLAEFAVWDVILTAAEFASLGKGYSPLLIRPASLVEHIPMVRNAISYKRAAPTLQGTTVQPHPRVIMPNAMESRRITATAPPFKPAWAIGSNLPVLGTGTY